MRPRPPTGRRRTLDEQWQLIRILERLPRRSGQLGLAALADREAERARATLAPLRRWDGISDASYRTYLNDANRVRLTRVLDFVEDGDRVLDVGTGFGYATGVLLRERRLAHYAGIDVKPRMRDAVASMLAANGLGDAPASVSVMDVHALTAEWMAPHRPDLALVLEVLEHLADPAAALRALRAALPHGAAVLFTVPILGRLEGVWGHVSLFDRERVAQVCRDAGLTIHHVEPVHATWTLVLASTAEEAPRRLRAAAATAPRLPRAKRRLARLLPEPAPLSHAVTPVTIDGHQDFARPGDDPGRVRLRHRLTGVFCEVDADADAPAEGGVRLPVTAPGLLRMQITCETPAALEAIEVVGLDAAGGERLRWAWRHEDRPISGEPMTHVLRVGRSSAWFRRDRGDDPSAVAAIDVVARARPGATASFRLHRAGFVAVRAPRGQGR